MKQTITPESTKNGHQFQATIIRMNNYGWDKTTIAKTVGVPESIVKNCIAVIENKQNVQTSFVKRDFDVTENELESFPNYRFEDVRNEHFTVKQIDDKKFLVSSSHAI